MSVIAEVLIAFVMVGLVSTLTAVLVLRMLYRRVRRNRALAAAALRTRAGLSAGPRRQVLKLRLRLGEVLASAQAASDLAERGDGPRGELAPLLRRIRNEAASLNAQLQLLESERDARALAEAAVDATSRVDQLAAMVRRLRSAVSAGLGDLSNDALDSLRTDVDREIEAVNVGVQELRILNAAASPHPAHPSSSSSSSSSVHHLHRGTTE